MTIEPVIFFFVAGYYVLFGAQIPTNILMYKICHVELGHDDSICNNMGSPGNEEIQEKVQIR